jgi:hypothetical protein
MNSDASLPCIVPISVGYVRFPSIRISTLLRVGNFIGVKILYVTPSWNRMVELVAKSGSAARIAGVSSFPGECGTVNVFQAPTSCTMATKEQSLAKFRPKGDIGEHNAGFRQLGLL